MMGAAGGDPPPPPALTVTLFIKVNITVTLHTLKSLALVSGNAQPVHVLLGPAGRTAIFFRPSRFVFVFFFCFVLLEALPTCVIVWPLSACLLQGALLCSSPHPTPLLAQSLPADPYRLSPPTLLPTHQASTPRAALSELAHLY